MSTVAMIVVGLIVVLFALQWKNMMRLLTALSAQFGKLSKWLWGIDAIAVYQAEVDKAAEEIGSAGEGLAHYDGMIARLKRQVQNGEKEQTRLSLKIEELLKEKNEVKATEYAVQLGKVESDLDENRAQLKTNQDTYDNDLKKVKYANEKIRKAKEKAKKMQADLRLSKAEAETAKLAKQFNVNTSTLDNLNEVEEEIQRQIDANRAKGHVIRDLSQDGLDEFEEDEKAQNAEAQAIIERFKAKSQVK